MDGRRRCCQVVLIDGSVEECGAVDCGRIGRELGVVGERSLQAQCLVGRHDVLIGMIPVGVLLQHALHGREVACLGEQLKTHGCLSLPLGSINNNNN